nr:uncharacterized protein LOC128683889 [Plodia interpunctella]
MLRRGIIILATIEIITTINQSRFPTIEECYNDGRTFVNTKRQQNVARSQRTQLKWLHPTSNKTLHKRVEKSDLICGNDAKTYKNYREFMRARLKQSDLQMVYSGPCPKAFKRRMHMAHKQKFIDFSFLRNKEDTSVCGSDVNTYNNYHELELTRVVQPNLKVLHPGQCVLETGVFNLRPGRDLVLRSRRTMKPDNVRASLRKYLDGTIPAAPGSGTGWGLFNDLQQIIITPKPEEITNKHGRGLGSGLTLGVGSKYKKYRPHVPQIPGYGVPGQEESYLKTYQTLLRLSHFMSSDIDLHFRTEKGGDSALPSELNVKPLDKIGPRLNDSVTATPLLQSTFNDKGYKLISVRRADAANTMERPNLDEKNNEALPRSHLVRVLYPYNYVYPSDQNVGVAAVPVPGIHGHGYKYGHSQRNHHGQHNLPIYGSHANVSRNLGHIASGFKNVAGGLYGLVEDAFRYVG